MLSPTEKRDRLRLFRSENVGPVTWARLIAMYGSATRALEALPDLAKRGGAKRTIKVATIRAAEEERDKVRALGARLLFLGDEHYPARLAALDDAPPILTVRGHPALLHKPCVAIVGSRNASANGCCYAEDLSSKLGISGLVVVSGLALGLDAAAHRGALATGTVAVMAGGVDVIYPPQNAALYERIVESGAVVSELPPGVNPTAHHFPRRNRIISGLSLGVVVVEGALRSGSLLTAQFALDQGREVMAVPGSPRDPRAHGPNGLIKSGASMIEEAPDVLRVLEPFLDQPISEPVSPPFRPPIPEPISESMLDSARRPIISALSPTPVPVDELVRLCQLSPSVVSVVLLELELAGRLNRHPGQQVSLIVGR